MKKTAILLALLIIFSFSCNKKYKFYAFYIEKDVEFTIPAGTEGLTEIELDNQQILTKSADIFAEKFTSADLVEEITIESVYVDSSSYSNINDLDIYISAQGEDEILLANNDSTNIFYRISGLQFLEYIELKSTTDQLDEYIKSDKITVITKGTLFQGITQKKDITLHMRFLVKTYVK